MSNHLGDTNKMVSDTPRTDDQIGYDGSTMSAIRIEFCRQLERELNEAQQRIKRLEDSYAAKDKQLSNLLHICRDNDIEVSSYDLIHGKEAKQ